MLEVEPVREQHLILIRCSRQYGQAAGLGVALLGLAGGLLVLENRFHSRGGPARDLHHEQDEWFYILEGDFVMEAGAERLTLRPGDSLLAPRQVPHV